MSIFQVRFEPTIHLTKSFQSHDRTGKEKKRKTVTFPSLMTKDGMEND